MAEGKFNPDTGLTDEEMQTWLKLSDKMIEHVKGTELEGLQIITALKAMTKSFRMMDRVVQAINEAVQAQRRGQNN